MLIDTHCHLNFSNFSSRLDEVLKVAADNNVGKIIDIACEIASWNRSLEISSKYKNINSVLGIHPHTCFDWNNEVRLRLIEHIKSDSNIKAIGEVGLDYFYLDKEKDLELQKDMQKKVFIDQLKLARDFEKPVVVHTRDAEEDTIQILKDYKDLKIVIHCFSGTSRLAKKMIEFGFYLSFTGMVTFPKMAWLIDIVKLVPQNKLMIETDSPYLAPVPLRGKDNEPSYLNYIFNFLVDNLDVKRDILKNQLYQNSVNFFQIK